MKPISITLQAFGPFCTTETVEFDHIDAGHGLFLICGDTGSGKSTLLDAMCFALFDDLPQDDSQRDAITLRSQHARDDTLTRVEFEFGLRGQHYRVIRSPTQKRPRKRGGGTTEQRSRAEFVQLQGERQIALADQPRKATQCIEELLGFSARQFRQIVVLPQGQFDRFLAAGSGDRETILAELFDSERYRRIELSLKASKNRLEKQLDSLTIGRDAVLKDIGVENVAELDARLIETEHLHMKKIAELATLKTALDASNQKLEKGQHVNRLLDKKAYAEKRLNAIIATKPEQDIRVNTLAMARAANALVDLWDDLKRRQQDHTQHLKNRDQSASALETAREALNAATIRHKEALANSSEIDQLRLRQKELESLKALTEDLPNVEQSLKTASETQQTQQKIADGLSTRLSTLELEMEKLKAASETGQSLASRAEVIKQKGLALKTVIDQHDRLAETMNDNVTTVKAIEKLEARHARQVAAYVELEKQQTVLEIAYRQGQATLLARKLSEGEPCPVCGSTEHPQYARATIDIPGQKDLDAIKRDISVKQNDSRATETALAEQKQKLSNGEDRRSELEDLLKEHKDTPRSALIAERDSLRKDYENTGRQLVELRTNNQKTETLAQEITQLRSDHESATAKLETVSSAVIELQTRYAERTQRLPEDLRTAASFSKAQRDTETTLARLSEELTKASEARENAHVAQNHTQSQLQALDTMLHDSEQQLTELNHTWVSRRTDAAFDNDDAVTGAMLADVAARQLETTIQEYERDKSEATGELKSCQQECADLAPVDIVQLQALQKTADENWHLANNTSINLANDLARIRKSKDALKQSSEDESKLEQAFGSIGKLADVAGGKNPLQLNLQRFVLGVLLDEVLASANIRLAEMTKGRYGLRRRSGSIDARRKGGLELDVFDEWTSDQRPVSTLSGGESFEAALALSLGLAEVSQNHAGGIELDTLFIDEGFGSLDQDSLDRVMTTLTRLKESKRMVGIISHVNELKERIDVRLEVTTGPRGSTTRWTGIPNS